MQASPFVVHTRGRPSTGVVVRRVRNVDGPHYRCVLTEIDPVLAARGCVARRGELLGVVSRGRLDHEIRSGRLVVPFTGTLCRPWDADLPEVRHRAALRSIGPPVALSHLSALRQWGMCRGWDAGADDDTVHVTVPQRRSLRGQDGLSVHRATVLPRVARLGGLRVVSRADAVAGSWHLMRGPDRRAPAIDAVRQRLVSAVELTDAVGRHPRIRGRLELTQLISLLAAGCESELEIWGLLHVFDVPGLRHGRRQRRLRVGSEEYRLDIGFDDERVAVELDGETWHSTREQRERDRRRDAALATIGWLTLRFSRRRLHTDVAGCRSDTLATLAARRGRASGAA